MSSKITIQSNGRNAGIYGLSTGELIEAVKRAGFEDGKPHKVALIDFMTPDGIPRIEFILTPKERLELGLKEAKTLRAPRAKSRLLENLICEYLKSEKGTSDADRCEG